MAVSEQHLSKGGYQVIGAASNDPSASGNAANFRVKLAQSLYFPGGGDNFAVCLQDAQFRHPGGNTSVYISTNLSTRIDGSELTESLVRIPPAERHGAYYYQVTTTLPLWAPLIPEELREVEVSFTTDDGEPIQVLAGDVSSVTLVIKRV